MYSKTSWDRKAKEHSRKILLYEHICVGEYRQFIIENLKLETRNDRR